MSPLYGKFLPSLLKIKEKMSLVIGFVFMLLIDVFPWLVVLSLNPDVVKLTGQSLYSIILWARWSFFFLSLRFPLFLLQLGPSVDNFFYTIFN